MTVRGAGGFFSRRKKTSKRAKPLNKSKSEF
nr:MAG TPA: hypothetical protein [Caudoviricetes sp.]